MYILRCHDTLIRLGLVSRGFVIIDRAPCLPCSWEHADVGLTLPSQSPSWFHIAELYDAEACIPPDARGLRSSRFGV